MVRSSSVSYTHLYYAFYTKNQFQIEDSASFVSPVSPFPFCATFAEVEVDVKTGIVKPLKVVTAMDCGVAVNPKLAEGQVLSLIHI